MKKLIYGSLFLALVGIGVVGCKKETVSKDSREITPEFEASKNLVSFKSIESYENFIDNYEEDQKEIALEKLKKSNFQNYFTKQENLVAAKNDFGTDSDDYEMDDRFGQLLNQDGVIRIGDYLFKVNLPLEEVRVVTFTDSDTYSEALSLINSSSKEVMLFSTDDDVLDLLTIGIQEKCGGSSSFNEHEDIDDQFGGKFTFRARYFKAGIYNRVRITGEHHHAGLPNDSEFYLNNLKFEVHVDTWWKSLRVRRRPCQSGHSTYHHGSVRDFTSWGSCTNCTPVVRQFNVYEQTRALNGYRVWVRGLVTIEGVNYVTPYFGRIVNANF